MKYLTRKANDYVARNKACQEVLDFVSKQYGILLESDEIVSEFISIIEDEILKINERHPRCKDLKLTQTWHEGECRLSITPYDVFEMELIKVKKEYRMPQAHVNRQLMTDFEDIDVMIDEMIWVGGIHFEDTRKIDSLLRELESSELEKMFENTLIEDFKSMDEGVLYEDLRDASLFGFIAKVLFPSMKDFEKDNDGDVWPRSTSFGICRVGYFYAESIQDLLEKISAHKDLLTKEFIELDKAKS
jgi:hypothetical protein